MTLSKLLSRDRKSGHGCEAGFNHGKSVVHCFSPTRAGVINGLLARFSFQLLVWKALHLIGLELGHLEMLPDETAN
jgi:hypothetical protein